MASVSSAFFPRTLQASSCHTSHLSGMSSQAGKAGVINEPHVRAKAILRVKLNTFGSGSKKGFGSGSKKILGSALVPSVSFTTPERKKKDVKKSERS